uniref:Beta-lactamase-related domain-containing protein n=1 Tax=Plectus sambesii TaxID=2011161 RepID=A0A914W077_9BILA
MASAKSLNDHHVAGTVDPGFEKVKEVFEKNFQDGWESQGAAFAAYWKGKKIIDIWGGFADRECARPWEEDTMMLAFSTTKAVCAICFAMLVEKGLVSYDDLVIKYWPEYGQNAKEMTTVRMLISHQAGLPYIAGTIEIEDIQDHTRMSKLLSAQKPIWEPGTKVGYHALTIGWLVDQIFRRTDSKQRGVAQFFREEIADVHGIEFFIGLPKVEQMRVARIKNTTAEEMLREITSEPRILMQSIDGLKPPNESNFFRMADQVSTMGFNFERFNDPAVRSLEIPAAGGVTTARDLAKIFSLVEQGKLLKKEMVNVLLQPFNIEVEDNCFGILQSSGHGFFHHMNQKGQWAMGHDGVGGQNVRLDVENQLCFAYLTNGMKLGSDHLTGTFAKIQKALYECIE